MHNNQLSMYYLNTLQSIHLITFDTSQADTRA